MSKTALNLFKSNAAIGNVQADGSVLPSAEFVRAMSMLFTRVGGAIGLGADDLALLASMVAQPDQQARRAAADAAVTPAIDQSALIAALIGKLAALQAQVSQVEGMRAELAKISRRLDGAEQLATFRDPFRVNWERPGRIGFFTANTGAFTALTAVTVNKLTLTPPATAATLTIANGKTLTATNSIALAGVDGKTLTINNTLGFTATDGAFLDIGNGGTLGSAAYQPATSFAARSSTALAPVATDPTSTQALANSIRSILISVGIGT